MVIWRWRQGAFTETKLYSDLPLRTTRRTCELERSDPGRVIFVAIEVPERDTESSDQGLGCLGGFGVEDLECEERVLEREAEREREPLVPNGPGRSGFV